MLKKKNKKKIQDIPRWENMKVLTHSYRGEEAFCSPPCAMNAHKGQKKKEKTHNKRQNKTEKYAMLIKWGEKETQDQK